MLCHRILYLVVVPPARVTAQKSTQAAARLLQRLANTQTPWRKLWSLQRLSNLTQESWPERYDAAGMFSMFVYESRSCFILDVLCTTRRPCFSNCKPWLFCGVLVRAGLIFLDASKDPDIQLLPVASASYHCDSD